MQMNSLNQLSLCKGAIEKKRISYRKELEWLLLATAEAAEATTAVSAATSPTSERHLQTKRRERTQFSLSFLAFLGGQTGIRNRITNRRTVDVTKGWH